ncbi:hypothetical protein L198_05712 [Cryptococcus wingfieldii CBS 7118]|uniref:Uncharacterized protein n=1 Tax=Cryptococcus wingfieldii CBS 7118 TaxID=1295528 RepID=A0A1E3ITU8_9TREE|nr:hypothetical protein L198_05712 [Cryptococcus wingfieldii CBS 7118]ODN92040.1 hypothetical protein L198_05712 [Cryptococcus wingfieldii CBS 7118]
MVMPPKLDIPVLVPPFVSKISVVIESAQDDDLEIIIRRRPYAPQQPPVEARQPLTEAAQPAEAPVEAPEAPVEGQEAPANASVDDPPFSRYPRNLFYPPSPSPVSVPPVGKGKGKAKAVEEDDVVNEEGDGRFEVYSEEVWAQSGSFGDQPEASTSRAALIRRRRSPLFFPASSSAGPDEIEEEDVSGGIATQGTVEEPIHVYSDSPSPPPAPAPRPQTPHRSPPKPALLNRRSFHTDVDRQEAGYGDIRDMFKKSKRYL